MNDVDSFRSTDFGKFLLETKLAGSGKEKFMIHWVRRFYDSRLKYQNMPWFEQLPFFLKELKESGNCQDWQIRQADQAVRLYICNFLMAQTSSPEAKRTEQSYTEWVKRYFAYCRARSTSSCRSSACVPDFVRDFLAHLAVEKNVSASTQNLAFNSLLMFFRLVYNKDLGDLKNAVRAKTGKRLPVVFSIDEVVRLLQNTEGTIGLMRKILYGGGLRDDWRYSQACLRSYSAPFLCHSFIAEGCGLASDSRTARSFEGGNDDDIYACGERYAQPGGQPVRSLMRF